MGLRFVGFDEFWLAVHRDEMAGYEDACEGQEEVDC